MLNQVVSSPVWQTVGVLILIIGTAITIIRYINRLPPTTTKNLLYILTVSLTVLLIAGTTGIIYILSNQNPTTPPASTPSISNPIATSILTIASSSPTPSPNPTATSTPLLNNYAAAQPGNNCDTGGGTWTSQGLNPFGCGQSINPVSTGVWGYLSLQLPNNAAFSANNEITVTGSTFDARWIACIGLAEIGTSTGYLVAYCGNGLWSIYTISNNGTIIRSIMKDVPTTIMTSTTISLALNHNILLFKIGTEKHQISVQPIQPTQIALGVKKAPGCDTCSILPTNFIYITPAS